MICLKCRYYCPERKYCLCHKFETEPNLYCYSIEPKIEEGEKNEK